MRQSFPEYASSVLSRGSQIGRTERGFEVISTVKGVHEDGHVVLPRAGSEPIVFSSKKKGEVRVREVALAGEGQIVDRAVAYGVPGGRSYWTATSNGAEEWFAFEKGAITDDRPAAIWEVAGAVPVQRDKVVAIVAESGKRLLSVSAPLAFLADGSQAKVRLSVRGSRIELFVQARGQAALVDPSWSFVAPMNFTRAGHTARRLTDGTVLVAGGETDQGGELLGGNVTNTSETYDEVSDQWFLQGGMNWQRIEHAMVTQPGTAPPDGAAMVLGGNDGFGFPLNAVETYDQADGFWLGAANLSDSRSALTATRLQDDRVLAAGGWGNCPALAVGGSPQSTNGSSLIGSGYCYVCTTEVFDPSGGGSGAAEAIGGGSPGAWNYTGDLIDCRAYHTETLLPDGRVLITGGEGASGILASAEIWDPLSGLWSSAAPMAVARELHTATLLDNGKVLVAGGYDGGVAIGSAEIYDPATDTWAPAPDLQAPRSQHGAVKMPDGRVLVTGGYNIFAGAQFTTELFDPATQQFDVGPDMNDYHAIHTETLLASGNVLVTGGDHLNGAPPISSAAEIFSLLNLIGQPCMVASECGSGFCVDGVCCDTVCDQPCEACTDIARGLQANAIGDPPNGGPGSGVGDGFCGPVFPGQDPANDCADQDPSTCGTVGSCDGNGGCEIFSDGTICQVPGCIGEIAQGGGLCDGGGSCVVFGQQDCSPFGCAGGVCATACVDSSECSPFAFCDGVVHQCAPKKPDGQVAFDPAQCLSGFLADGVCCDTACDTACDACSVQTGATKEGVCTPLTNVQCNDGDACTTVDICQNGVCVGGAAVSCPGDTGCKGGLACDSKTGQCTIPTPPKKVGDPCDDGLMCTSSEACDIVGNCQGKSLACTPGECQSAGMCVEGQGCQFTDKVDYTPCTVDENPCTIEWCVSGACIINNLTDFTQCPGGVCIGGTCLLDSGNGGDGGGGSGQGGGNGGGGSGQGGGNGGDAGTTGTGTAGDTSGNGNEAAYKLQGAGCAVPSDSSSSSSGKAGLLVALLGLAGIVRRRRGGTPSRRSARG